MNATAQPPLALRVSTELSILPSQSYLYGTLEFWVKGEGRGTEKAFIPVLQPYTLRDLAIAPMDTLHIDFLELGPCSLDPLHKALLNIIDCRGTRRVTAPAAPLRLYLSQSSAN